MRPDLASRNLLCATFLSVAWMAAQSTAPLAVSLNDRRMTRSIGAVHPDGRRKYRSALSPCDQPSGVRPNSAPYPAHRSASVAPAMPVIVQVFFEERRQGRRRGSLKGYATDAAKIGCTICAALYSICQVRFSQCGQLPPRFLRSVNPAGGDLFQGAVDFFIKRAAFFAGATLFSGHQYLLSSW